MPLIKMNFFSRFQPHALSHLIPWALFIASRLWIFFGFNASVSDLPLYFESGLKWATEHAIPYREFFWPYPPLSLFFIRIPFWLGAHDYETYRTIFRVMNLTIDVFIFWKLMKSIQKTKLDTSENLIITGIITAITGLCMGHLIYDRLDLGIAAILVLLVNSTQRISILVWGWIGLFFKFIPFLFSAFSLLITDDRILKKFKTALVQLLVATLTFCFFSELLGPSFLHLIGEHGERGIQIESIWATPFAIQNIIFGTDHWQIDTNFGAQHIASHLVPLIYLNLAKYFGWFFILVFFIYHFIYQKSQSLEQRYRSYLWLIVLFITTQRVLSPQFLIWMMPFVAFPLIELRGLNRAMVILIYLFTYIEFGLGYFKLVDGDKGFMIALICRNILLVVLLTRLSLFNYRQLLLGPKRVLR